jgi:hypothetical protein
VSNLLPSEAFESDFRVQPGARAFRWTSSHSVRIMSAFVSGIPDNTVRKEILFALALVVPIALAQIPAKGRKRAVALETLLSCADDSLIEEIFKADSDTARFKLSALLMIGARPKTLTPEYLTLLGYGFNTQLLDDSTLEVLPTDHLGHYLPQPLPFCHNNPIARYEKAGTGHGKSGPNSVELSGEGWVLNSNEVFAHADQFQFHSGVFADSPDVFLTATKGRVSLQFICKPDGLKLYRAIYLPKD